MMIKIIEIALMPPNIKPKALSKTPSPIADINEDNSFPKILIEMNNTMKININDVILIACGLDTKLDIYGNSNGDRNQPIKTDPIQEIIENKSFKSPRKRPKTEKEIIRAKLNISI
mgnify:FL=1